MKHLLICILAILSIASAAMAQDITGKWYGKADINGFTLRVAYDIEGNDSDGYTATMQSTDQSSEWKPVETVTFIDGTLTLSIPTIGFSYKGKLVGEEIHGTFTQRGTFPLNLSRQPIERNRPQEPKLPFPYESEEVTFVNEKDNIRLAGTFTFGKGSKGYPAVILVSGSGAQNRDEELLGHKPFLVLSDYLTQRGIAVLRYDDRGAGESEGDFASSTTYDFANDALAAVEYLKNRPEVNPDKVGVIGHSEGGVIAFILAAEKAVSFIVTLGAPGVDGGSLLNMQQEAIARAQQMPEALIAQYVSIMKQGQDMAVRIEDKEELEREIRALTNNTFLAFQADEMIKQLSDPWIKEFIQFDPARYFPAISCPVLALNGEKDLQVPATVNLNAIKEGIKTAGNKNVETKAYPNLNHLFQTAGTGLHSEYGEIEETFNQEVLKDIGDWILGLE